jgi:Tfp pilus assembly protein PilF
MKYDAFNALCLSLTADKQFSKAMEACDNAIEHSPKRWQAFNSRGSLNYKNGKFDSALNDYRIALENAPNQSGVKKIIEHNIKISEPRVSNK